jgi:hypothetical protein
MELMLVLTIAYEFSSVQLCDNALFLSASWTEKTSDIYMSIANTDQPWTKLILDTENYLIVKGYLRVLIFQGSIL